jgi:GTP-binding protein
MNTYKGAQFIKSAPSLKSCPKDSEIEIAFAGRSNAGKSSALNTLTGNPKLSRISKTPGRTQMINFFGLGDEGNDGKYLVDLPGYGYAKVPEKVKREWQQALGEYLAQRDALKGVVVLMDIRHPLTETDRAMLAWSEYDLNIHVLLTKADKLKFGAAKNTLLKLQKELNQNYPNVSVSLFSALKKTGVDELVTVLDSWFSI